MLFGEVRREDMQHIFCSRYIVSCWNRSRGTCPVCRDRVETAARERLPAPAATADARACARVVQAGPPTKRRRWSRSSTTLKLSPALSLSPEKQQAPCASLFCLPAQGGLFSECVCTGYYTPAPPRGRSGGAHRQAQTSTWLRRLQTAHLSGRRGQWRGCCQCWRCHCCKRCGECSCR